MKMRHCIFSEGNSNLLKTNGENDLMKMLIIYCFIIFCCVSGTISFFFGMSEWQCLLDMKKLILWLSFRHEKWILWLSLFRSNRYFYTSRWLHLSTMSPKLSFKKVPKKWVGCWFNHQIPCRVHPGRLTFNLQITHLERKIIFQTSMIMFHVNLPGCIWHGVFSVKRFHHHLTLRLQELMTAEPERVCGELLSGAGIRNAMWLCAFRTLGFAMMG